MYKKMDLGISLDAQIQMLPISRLAIRRIPTNIIELHTIQPAGWNKTAFFTAVFSLFNRRADLHLPKISISGSYDVKSLFKEMGITDVFSSNADLSGISGSRDLQVSQVSGWTELVLGWLLVFMINYIWGF